MVGCGTGRGAGPGLEPLQASEVGDRSLGAFESHFNSAFRWNIYIYIFIMKGSAWVVSPPSRFYSEIKDTHVALWWQVLVCSGSGVFFFSSSLSPPPSF